MTTNKPEVKRYEHDADGCAGEVWSEMKEVAGGEWIKASDYEALQAECEQMHSLLRKCQPIMRAHAGATHMLDGFRPKRNKWDELADRIDLALLDYRKQRAQQ